MQVMASRHNVWELLLDFQHYWKWHPLWTDFHLGEKGVQGPIFVRCKGVSSHSRFKGVIERFDVPQTMCVVLWPFWRKWFCYRWYFILEATAQEQTKVTLRVELNGWMAVRYRKQASPLITLNVDALLYAIKQQMEGG